MTSPLPPPLQRLLAARPGVAFERAWEAFLLEYSQLLLDVARTLGGSNDAVMDRYLYGLEALRRDDLRRLRAYAADPRARFETWLAFVMRNLSRDHHRLRYGRPQSTSAEALAARRARRSLTDLVAAEIDADALAAADESAETRLRRQQLKISLDAALEALDPHDRLLVRLRFEDELSVPRIARMTGYPNPFAVYRRLDRILAELRVRLREAGVEDPVA